MTLRAMLVEVVAVLTSTGLKLSPSVFSAAAMPKNIVDLAFTLDLQTVNTQQYRGGADAVMRLDHTLTVTFVKVLKPLDQHESQLACLDIQERVMRAMQAGDAFDFIRVTYLQTTTTLSAAREHLVVDLTFRVDQDFTWA
jgi:hypothetical protein